MNNFNSLLLKEFNDNIKKNNQILVIDIDGVVASIVEDGDYSKSKPIRENIIQINKLKKAGLKIIFFTARGSVTGKDWMQVTKDQFKEWGLLYDELKFGKPAADLYIDDKAATPSVLSELVEKLEKTSNKRG